MEESYERVTSRESYYKENHNYNTNLDISVFISAPKISEM